MKVLLSSEKNGFRSDIFFIYTKYRTGSRRLVFHPLTLFPLFCILLTMQDLNGSRQKKLYDFSQKTPHLARFLHTHTHTHTHKFAPFIKKICPKNRGISRSPYSLFSARKPPVRAFLFRGFRKTKTSVSRRLNTFTSGDQL